MWQYSENCKFTDKEIPPRICSDYVPTLRVGILILYPNLGYGIVLLRMYSGKQNNFPFVRLTTKILEQWNSVLPNRGQTMFLTILEFCQGLNDVVQTSPPVQYNNAGLSRAPFPRKLEADHP